MPSRSSGSVKVFYPTFSREEVLALLRERVALLQEQLPLRRVVLFGSYAKGRHTVASDVDVLVVYDGRARADAYALVKRTLRIRRLEPHVYAEEEMKRVGDMIERMVQGGIPIYPFP